MQQTRRSQNLQTADSGMADDVSERQVAVPQADLDEDQSDLRHRCVSQGALDVGLRSTDESGVEGRQQTNRDDGDRGDRRLVENRTGPQQQIGTEMYRDRTIEDRARRRRPLHRPRQPAAERDLGRLAHRRPQQHQSDRRRRRRALWDDEARPRGRRRRRCQHRRRPDFVVQPNRRGQQADVARAIGQEGPETVLHRSAAFTEERNQQRRRQTYDLPAEENQVEGAGEHHQLDRCPEERQQQIESAIPELEMQIASPKRTDQANQQRSEPCERHRQVVGHQGPLEVIVPASEPGTERKDDGIFTRCQHADNQHRRRRRRTTEGHADHRIDGGLPQPPPKPRRQGQDQKCRSRE